MYLYMFEDPINMVYICIFLKEPCGRSDNNDRTLDKIL